MTRASRLTLTQAKRPVYIDFEGTATDPPSLLGVLAGEEFTQYVIEPALWPAAGFRG